MNLRRDLRPALLGVCFALGACSSEQLHSSLEGSSKRCYSPTQNADSALDEGARGCACSEAGAAECVHTSDHGYVAFFCEAGRWQSGFDGPCGAVEKSCYSPTQHPERAYEEGAHGCACADGDEAQCIGGVALVCEGGAWQAVEDGPCAPEPPAQTCLSPSQDEALLRQALQKWPSLDAPTCACGERDADVCAAGFGWTCDQGTWRVALDGPCAPKPACYSPTAAEIAKQPGSVGCACGPGDKDVCIHGVALICQDGAWKSVVDGPCFPPAPCAPGYKRSPSPGSMCVAQNYTLKECSAAQGIALADPGDGSLLRNGCPRHMETLGFVVAGWDEGGLCCKQTAASCFPQKATWQGMCFGAPHFYWQGSGCAPQTGCSCVGPDCASSYLSEADCRAAFAGCPTPRACGARAGDTCSASEYCAYKPEGICGHADAESVCSPRPTSCGDIHMPVCGCDGKSYPNECEANRAGTGILSLGDCP